jgi:hypothetical protein
MVVMPLSLANLCEIINRLLSKVLKKVEAPSEVNFSKAELNAIKDIVKLPVSVGAKD